MKKFIFLITFVLLSLSLHVFHQKTYAQLLCGINFTSACGDRCSIVENYWGATICSAPCAGFVCIQTSGYTGSYTGGYTGSYTGGYTGSYTGTYTGSYTSTYTTTYAPPDLRVVEHVLTDVNGNVRNNFAVNAPIYLSARITNDGPGEPYSSNGRIYHRFYPNQPTAFGSYTSFGSPYLDTSTNWGTVYTYHYGSYPSHERQGQFGSTKYYTQSTPGTYTSRLFSDNEGRVAESVNFNNNQGTARYTVGPPPDLIPENFVLTDSSGVEKTAFAPGEQIYPKVTIRNQGGSRGISNSPTNQFTYNAFYSNLATNASINQTSDVNVTLRPGEFNAGASGTYFCRPAPGTNCSSYIASQFWSRPTVGTYTAQIAVNYNRNIYEGNYANNHAYVTYTVGYTVSGRVFIDNDHSNSYSSGDEPLSGVGVNFEGTVSRPPTVTNSQGQYTFTGLPNGTYTVSMVTPDGLKSTTGSYQILVARTVNVSGGNQSGIDYPLVGRYSVAGEAFVDENNDGIKNGAETSYPGTPAVSVPSRPPNSPLPRILPTSNGGYSITGFIGPRDMLTGSSLPGYSGIGYLITSLDLGRDYTTTTANAPSASYSVNFQTPGTYRIWTRGWGASGNSDSYHMFYDNTAVSTADDIDITESTNPQYAWSSSDFGGSTPTINVASAGTHTISIHTREDGTIIDKIYLTTNQSSTPPSGTGPAQSAVIGGVFQATGGQLTIEAESFTSSVQNPSNYSVQIAAPQGYFAVSPVPPTYSIVMTGTCPITPSPNPPYSIGCSSGSLTGLNFAFSLGASWFQTRGGDVRFDQGFSDPIPGTPQAVCGGAYASRTGPGSLSPGVIFSGGSNPSFGAGSASSSNWRAGSSTYPEIYKPANPTTLRTSYEYLLTSIEEKDTTLTDLASSCGAGGIGNCSISNLPSGHYRADGDLTLSSFTMAPNAQIVILVNGNLDINTNINVPQASSLVVSSRGTITVSPNIGTQVTGGAISCPPDGQIEGLYSADDDFVIESNAVCSTNAPDRQLAIEGVIVAGADLDGGAFQNARTLCDRNTDYPSLVVTQRPDILLNLPEIIKVPTYTWREVAP